MQVVVFYEQQLFIDAALYLQEHLKERIQMLPS